MLCHRLAPSRAALAQYNSRARPGSDSVRQHGPPHHRRARHRRRQLSRDRLGGLRAKSAAVLRFASLTELRDAVLAGRILHQRVDAGAADPATADRQTPRENAPACRGVLPHVAFSKFSRSPDQNAAREQLRRQRPFQGVKALFYRKISMKHTRSILTCRLSLPLFAGLLAGCTDAITHLTGTSATTSDEADASELDVRIAVQVVDEQGRPLADVEVALADQLRTSAPSGVVLFDAVTAGVRHVVRAQRPGYTTGTAVFDRPAADIDVAQVVTLHSLGLPAFLPADKGGTAERGGARVTVPPHAFVDAAGEPVQGEVAVTVVPLDPTAAQALQGMPGPLEAVRGDATAVRLEPVMMAEVSAWQGDQRLQLAPGVTATLSFLVPAALRSTAPVGTQIPGWHFDDSAGLWREDGIGVVELADGEPRWTIEVTHFTWWNSDKPWTDENCYAVTLVDHEGVPVSGTQIFAQGTSYVGLSTAFTDGQGTACVETLLGGEALLLAGPLQAALVSQAVQGAVQEPGDCAGSGSCAAVTLTLPVPVLDCLPGLVKSCYSGDPNNAEIGACHPGTCSVVQSCGLRPDSFVGGGFFFGMGPSLACAARRQRYNRDGRTSSSSASSCADWPGLFSLRTAFA